MKVIVGSTNNAKVSAVAELLRDYTLFRGAQVTGISVSSDVGHQPMTLKETIEGARNRAKAAFSECDYSVGIESGLFEAPYTKSGYLDVCAAVFYDGKAFHLGLSSAFEYPKAMIQLVLDEGMEINDAQHKLGFSENPKVGSAEGVVGILTKGRVDRKTYTKQALTMALVHLENKELYE